jgi:ppGpp synthetase/RelA/SpoT-type nucleotidyltranferase
MNDHEKCVEALNVVEKFQYELSLRRHTPIPIDRVEERLKEIQEILES